MRLSIVTLTLVLGLSSGSAASSLGMSTGFLNSSCAEENTAKDIFAQDTLLVSSMRF
jgi:hypothetical protein